MVLYPVAHDTQGSVVWADQLAGLKRERRSLSCVGCGSPVVFRSGSRRPHFAHKAASSGCDGETALHRLTKTLVAERLEDATTAYPLRWRCSCGAPMERDLNQHRPLQVLTEQAHGPRVPDLQVQRGGRTRYVIEVVVEHEPEPEALHYYDSQRIAVVVVRPTWDTVGLLREALDLPAPADKRGRATGLRSGVEVLHAPSCGSASHPSAGATPCPRCAAERSVLALSVSVGQLSCRRCEADVPVLDVLDEGGFRLGAASTFAGIQSAAARLRVSMGRRYSKTREEEYVAHLCPRCGLFQGDFFVYHERDVYEGVSDTRGMNRPGSVGGS